MKRAETGAQFILPTVAPTKLRNLEEPEPMGARLGRVTKAGAKGFRSLQLICRVRPLERGKIMVPAVDAFINFHFRSCNVGEYASVNTNLYIRTEGALSCMLSPASILQASRSGSSSKLHDKRYFEAVFFSSRMQG